MVLLSCYRHVNATESPPYTVVLSAPDLEIRLYRDSSWISAAVAGGTSFNKSTHDGFHRLYQYVHGGNEYNTRFKITTPTVTTVTAAASNGSSDYLVSMYVASISSPPMASPQLNLHISNWKNHCVAVRRFSGFAGDDNIYKERSLLSFSLAKSLILNGKNVSISDDKSSYSIAQYNASSHLSGRVNEAWINVIPCPVLH
ncbi:uncharacterized protein LOC112524268 [Cynara cardunculus var. scolymus]|uniref:Regulatory factor, effector, bacterial n=1 Tax=Cynara cardunculus var. scolymus TaxID=59895 RepID=A0A103YAU5_CYNCS|nr:uncharacterized protein LOC112524268 [Cynara cardunculus var. scolymus]KVI05667.1 Regulatory factor, effector, bacterial [Cynara cardunculus var. scolymus]